MTGGAISFQLKNCLSELDTLCQHLEDFGNAHGLSEKIILELNLALDELFTNIISHGHRDDLEHWVKFNLSIENDKLIINIEDDGISFDPGKAEKPDTQCTLENRKIGGLGIYFVKKLMDTIYYKRCENKNFLTLIKDLKTD